jgi:hypothetical protein
VKTFAVLAVFVGVCALSQAQPVGPVDALIYSQSIFSSIATSSLYWLRPDGTYVVLFGRSKVSALPETYTSGRTGTYTLRVNVSNPKWRDLAYDNNPPRTLDFDTFNDPTLNGASSNFVWSERSTSDSVVGTSSRALATADHPAIAGFFLSGTKARWVLVRGIGPALFGYGVADPATAPRLTVYGGINKLDENVGWTSIPELATGLETVFNLVGAFALPRGSTDCAILLFLPPGAYTALTVPTNNQTAGSTLTEIYLLPFGN